MKSQIAIEKLADEYAEQFRLKIVEGGWKRLCMNDFIAGYTQCQNDNTDKKYTEEDLKNAFEGGQKSIEGVVKYHCNSGMDSYASTEIKYGFKEWCNKIWKYGKDKSKLK